MTYVLGKSNFKVQTYAGRDFDLPRHCPPSPVPRYSGVIRLTPWCYGHAHAAWELQMRDVSDDRSLRGRTVNTGLHTVGLGAARGFVTPG